MPPLGKQGVYKDIEGKPDPSLVPTQIIYDIMECREYGVKKYGDPENWKKVGVRNFIKAFLRHTLSFWGNPYAVDEESGISHYKLMACNLAFICEYMREITPLQETLKKRGGYL